MCGMSEAFACMPPLDPHTYGLLTHTPRERTSVCACRCVGERERERVYMYIYCEKKSLEDKWNHYIFETKAVVDRPVLSKLREGNVNVV